MADQQERSGTVLFVQVNNFSYTNEALARSIGPFLEGYGIEEFKLYQAIRKNPFYLMACILGVAFYYGPKSLLDRKAVTEQLIKTPVFFKLASRLARAKARRIPNLTAVLQTQGLFNAKVPGVPLIIYTDNTILNRINRAAVDTVSASPIVELEKELYRQADAIAVSASHVVTSLVEDYAIQPENLHNVLIGANAPELPAAPAERFASQHVLFVGIDWQRKGGPDLLRAFADVSKSLQDARLTIVGCRPETDQSNVIALGKIPPAEVASLMAGSAVYCMPSHIEPSSVAVIEAARSGLPVVATRTGGFLDSVKDGETGFLVAPGDSQALAAALQKLLGDPALAERMGKAGAEWIRQFDWKIVSQKIADIIRAKVAVAPGR